MFNGVYKGWSEKEGLKIFFKWKELWELKSWVKRETRKERGTRKYKKVHELMNW